VGGGKEGAGGPRYYGHEVFLKLDARPKATRRYFESSTRITKPYGQSNTRYRN